MTPLAWSAEYEVGIPQIDDDHRELLVFLNAVYIAASSEMDRQAWQAIIYQLICQTGEHFAREELLMRKNQYSSYHAHKSEHERLLLEIHALYAMFEREDIALSNAVLKLLNDWLFEHIITSDRAFAASLRNLGYLTAHDAV